MTGAAHKVVRSPDDLAVNGAPPAFSRPLHVGRPNVGDRDEFLRLVGEMFDRNWLTNDGPLVRELEREIADHLGVAHCVCVSNGTIGLEIAIRALGLEGEVIVPSFTFVATAHALEWQGITPVFADIDPETHNLDPDSVRTKVTDRTTGILGVHVWGRPAPVHALQQIADEHGLALLFDAAHAFGCTHELRPIGSFGRAEVLSFHSTKFFNSFEGGAVVTDDAELAETVRLMRNFGFSGYDRVVHPGTNGKMTEVCAAMGLVNLKSVDDVVQVNRRNHEAYRRRLERVPGLTMLAFDERERHNYQYVVCEVTDESAMSRDALLDVLHGENILARRYFYPGCHRMEPYRSRPTAPLALEHTEAVAGRVLVLPTGRAVSEAEIDVVVDVIEQCASGWS
jgi:dTDP-4-amino-4,6-dideoxygalactose transaminase